MSQAIDVTPAQREQLVSLLSTHLPNTEAWVYGSRARWTSRPESDLDMAVFATPAQARNVYALREALEESNLPFRVDLFVWDEVPDSFREQIRREHVVLTNATDEFRPRRACVALGDLIDLRLSSVDKKSKPDEMPVRLCNYTDVYHNAAIRRDMPFMDATASDREIAKCALSAGDVVITKDSEQYNDIGVPAYVMDDVPNLVCGYHLAILRPNVKRIDGRYLFYALSTHNVQTQFHHYANGVTRFGLRKADIGLVEIPLPCLPEQHAIAHILGTLDDKIELNRRMNETLEAMAQALFKSWFVDFEPVRAKMHGRDTGLPQRIAELFPDRMVDSERGEIPDGWHIRPLTDLVDVNPRRQLRKGQVAPYLDMANMPTKGHVPNSVVDRAFGSGMRFANGDTLIARITPCLENGKAAYVDFLSDGQTGWGSTEYIVMRPRSPLPHEFAYLLAKSSTFREFAIQNMTGTSGRQRVQANTVKEYPLARPTDPVALAFGELVRPLIARGSAAVRESRSLASLRDTLLPKLISGEFRVSHSECVLEAPTTPVS